MKLQNNGPNDRHKPRRNTTTAEQRYKTEQHDDRMALSLQNDTAD